MGISPRSHPRAPRSARSTGCPEPDSPRPRTWPGPEPGNDRSPRYYHQGNKAPRTPARSHDHAIHRHDRHQSRHLEPAGRPPPGLRPRRQRGPRRHPLRRPGQCPLRPLPPPGRLALRRPHPRRRPDLRRPQLGLPLRHRRQLLQPGGGAPQVRRVDRHRRRRRIRGRGRGRGVARQVPAGLQPRRIPGTLRRCPRDPGGAPQPLHPGACAERAGEGRASRGGVGDGGAAHRTPRVERPADPDRTARHPPPRGRRPGGHGAGHRSPVEAAAAPRNPRLRERHELRRPERRGQARARQGGGDGPDRNLLGRRRHAAGGTAEQLSLPLRVGVREVRVVDGEGVPLAGLPLQGGTGGEDRDGGTPSRDQGDGQESPRFAASSPAHPRSARHGSPTW